MRLILLHSDEFSYKPRSKAIKSAEEIEKKVVSVEEALVVMIAVEKSDEEHFENAADQTIQEIVGVADEIKANNVVVYPWVHLTSTPSRPDIAIKVMKQVEKNLKDLGRFDEVKRAPFGWYKGFTITVKGHPLSELSREFTAGSEKKEIKEESEAIAAEEEAKHEFFVVEPDADPVLYKEYNFKPKTDFKIFFNYETQKRRASDKPPAHVALMQRLELVDYEPASDAGNLRWYPSGWLIKRLLEDHVTNTHIDHGAHCVETPIMYNYLHPALEKYMNRFPARQYEIRSGSDKYFLRFAACFGQFLIGADALMSYKQMPVKMFEMTHYSFRREQRGELAALRRLRTFSMPDQHTLAANIEQARDEFKKQYELSVNMMNAFELDYEAVFRFQTDFYNENKEWFNDMVKLIDKPVMLELFDKRYAYFVCKFEFNVVDGQKKAAALSTVQIDVENAERFDINFINDKGEKVKPYILHASLSGAIERVVYAILERAHLKSLKGIKPSFPFWLAPIQVRLCPISDDQHKFTDKLADKLEKYNIRVDIDNRNERVGKKVRDAERIWIPYIVVIGDNEVNSKVLKARMRDGTEKEFNIDTMGKELAKFMEGYPTKRLPMAKYLTLRPQFYSSN